MLRTKRRQNDPFFFLPQATMGSIADLVLQTLQDILFNQHIIITLVRNSV